MTLSSPLLALQHFTTFPSTGTELVVRTPSASLQSVWKKAEGGKPIEMVKFTVNRSAPLSITFIQGWLLKVRTRPSSSSSSLYLSAGHVQSQLRWRHAGVHHREGCHTLRLSRRGGGVQSGGRLSHPGHDIEGREGNLQHRSAESIPKVRKQAKLIYSGD